MKFLGKLFGSLAISLLVAAAAWYVPVYKSEPSPKVVAQLDAIGSALADARTVARPWVAGAQQFRDVDLQDRSLAAIQTALHSDRVADQRAGLVALADSVEVIEEFGGGFDALRPRIRLLARQGDVPLAGAALAALASAGPSSEDAALAVEIARSIERPEVATMLANSLVTLADHDVSGDVADVLLTMLDAGHEDARKEAYSALWGARVDDRVAGAVADLSRSWTYGEAGDVIYHATSRIMNKNDEIVDVLVDAVADESIAAYGLTFGVAPDEQSRVCDVLVDLAASHVGSQNWRRFLGALSEHGETRHAEALRALVNRGLLDADQTVRIEATITAIAQR